jgi:hypothetical protein
MRIDVGNESELDPSRSSAPWRIYNIGNNTTVEVSRVVELLEQELGRKAKTELVPMQPRRCARGPRQCRRFNARRRIPAVDADRGRRSSIHRMVSGLSQRVKDGWGS